ncbi:MAG: hypothetical protein HY255_09770, partial [Betaproteobacteria bacterium]|nr:hypothetical protein [Betaproteobacteria bacterium]
MATVPGFDGAVDQDKIISMTVHKTHAMPRCSGTVVENHFGINRWVWHGLALLVAAALSACGTQPVARLDGHLKKDTKDSATAGDSVKEPPQPVRQVPLPPPPQPRIEEVKYSVVVDNQPVQEVLFAIARDTNVNIDVHSGIEGRITLNAINQTLKQILTRIAKQVDMRYEVDGPNLVVMPDTPFLKFYHVDYVNIARDSTGTMGVQTQVVSPAGVTSSSSSGSGQNSSQVKLTNTSNNRFWENLTKNIQDILRETDKLLPEGNFETTVRGKNQSTTNSSKAQTATGSVRGQAALDAQAAVASQATQDTEQGSETYVKTGNYREAASVIINPETGTIFVRATGRQHEKVAEFIEQISGASRRQVLIEATVVEVLLNDNYQGGVDWSALGLDGLGYSFRQSLTPAAFTSVNSTSNGNPFVSIGYSNPNAAAGGSISSVTKLLSSFGTTKVLSSPKIMTLNNQTAVMKVVQNKVYFTAQSTVIPGSLGVQAIVTTNTTPNVVPEGFVMNVTPQISDKDVINLNIRPSVTRITGFIIDPNPVFTGPNSIQSRVPEVQTREFESMLRLASGQTAIMGGLMEDTFATARDGL